MPPKETAYAANLAAQLADQEQVDLPATIPSDFDHYYDYLHFTQQGCRAVGQAVANRIAAPGQGAAPAPDAAAPKSAIELKSSRSGSR